MANISKVKIDETVYGIKDTEARTSFNSYVGNGLPGHDSIFYSKIKTQNNITNGNMTVALGQNTAANGNNSIATGNNTTASGESSYAGGSHTTASGSASHAEGLGKYDITNDTWTDNLASGEASHVEGRGNIASGDHSHAEGCETTSSGHAAHTEGCSNTAAASYSHVEGVNNVVTKDPNDETGVAAHVEGANNTAAASYSHAQGYGNTIGANALYSHVSGEGNISAFPHQIVIGTFNDNIEHDILEIGNGEDENTRSNSLRLTDDNRLYLYLDDVLFNTTVEGQPGVFSLLNAAVVDDNLNETSTHPVQNKVINEQIQMLFQYVSEGKKLIADALTDLGVEVPEDPTFQQLADLITSINPGYEVDSRYLFVRESKYTTQEGDVFPIPAPVEGESDGSFINFYTVSNE